MLQAVSSRLVPIEWVQLPDKTLKMYPASIDHNGWILRVFVFRPILTWWCFREWFIASDRSVWMKGNSKKHLDSTAALHPAQCGGAVKQSTLTIGVHHRLGYIHHIPHNNQAHYLLKVVTKDEKDSIVITAIFFWYWLIKYCCNYHNLLLTILLVDCKVYLYSSLQVADRKGRWF